MKIQIFDKGDNEIFKMAFNFEVDTKFVTKLIKLVSKHKLIEGKREKDGFFKKEEK